MKIIGIVGSPHGLKGNTAKLLNLVLKGAEGRGTRTEVVPLKGGSVLPCRGCDICHRMGACVQKDEFETLKRKILDADGIVLASPNYVCGVSAQMKAFMDRCCGIIHMLGFEGKYGASVVTSGGGDEEPICSYMNRFLMMTGTIPVGSTWATMGSIQGDDFPEEIRKRAASLGQDLVSAWERKIVPPGLEKSRKEFYDRMWALMQYRKQEWPYEYEYWIKHRRQA